MSAETMRELCQRHGLTIKYLDHGVQTSEDSGEKWEHKRFTVTLFRTGAPDYGAPIGYRMGIPTLVTRRESVAERRERERRHRQEIQRRVPAVDGVVAALLSDASCFDTALDFADFCASFGHDTDSIRARDNYLACGKTSKRIRVFLGPMFGDFCEAMKDY